LSSWDYGKNIAQISCLTPFLVGHDRSAQSLDFAENARLTAPIVARILPLAHKIAV